MFPLCSILLPFSSFAELKLFGVEGDFAIFFEETEVPEFPVLKEAGIVLGPVSIEGGFF